MTTIQKLVITTTHISIDMTLEEYQNLRAVLIKSKDMFIHESYACLVGGAKFDDIVSAIEIQLSSLQEFPVVKDI